MKMHFFSINKYFSGLRISRVGCLMIAVIFMSIGAMAKPAVKAVMRVIQPDGSELSIVKRGDERGHKVYTADGFSVVKNAEGVYEYAESSDDGRLVASGIVAKDAEFRSAEENLGLSLRSGSWTAKRERHQGTDLAPGDKQLGHAEGNNSGPEGDEAEMAFRYAQAAGQRGGGIPGDRLSTRRQTTRTGGGKLSARRQTALAGGAELSTQRETGGILAAKRGMQTRGPGLYSYEFPTKGEQKGLVILVEFSDVKFNSKNKAPYNTIPAHTYFSDMLNKEGFDTYGGTGSVRDWFIDNSKGKFKPEFDVFGPVTLTNTMKYYGENDRWTDDDKRPAQMVVDACKALDEQINFKDYDRNGDGYVDNVYVFYAGYGEADTNESDAIWPHSWTISDATGMPLNLDGVYIDSYGCSSETCGYNEYGSLMSRPDGIGTFVHEFSHVMGLPDLYATEYSTSYMDEPFTPGAFSVLDYGPYNNEGRTPPNYSAYERYALDWLVPEELTVGGKTLEEIGTSNKAFIAKTEKDQEYYLFENRQLTGWDKYLPYHGMLVWHVDYYAPVFYNNTVNNTKNHQYVDLVEADNIQDYPLGYNRYPSSTQSGDPFPGLKDVKEFGPSTTPAFVSWGGKPAEFSLIGIAESAGAISFEVASANSSVNETVEVCDGKWEVYTLDGKSLGAYTGFLPAGIYILRSRNGETRKIAIR